jgi:hypothetical protein
MAGAALTGSDADMGRPRRGFVSWPNLPSFPSATHFAPGLESEFPGVLDIPLEWDIKITGAALQDDPSHGRFG